VLSIDHFKNARWGDLYAFFAQGNPPLVLQLLILNTIFLGFIVYRRATGKFRMRKSSVFAIQMMLVATNVIFMFQKDAFNAAKAFKHMV
jgi:hypothetical protein